MDSGVPQAEHVQLIVDPVKLMPAYARHRRRFAASVAALDEQALAAPSRCERWTVADVLRHGLDVDGWMDCIWSGRPLPFDSFDVVRTPDQFVSTGRSTPDAEVRDRFVASCEVMAAEVEGSDADRWGVDAFSPLGPVPWWLSTMHVFYDSWVHERDALLPLDVEVPVEEDEVVPVLAYNLALVGMFLAEPTDVVVAGVRLEAGSGGPTVVHPKDDARADPALVDALSGRGPLDVVLADCEPEVVHRLGALSRLFHS